MRSLEQRKKNNREVLPASSGDPGLPNAPRAFVAYRMEDDDLIVRLSDGGTLSWPLRERRGEARDEAAEARRLALSYLLGQLASGVKVFETEPFDLQDWEPQWSQTELTSEQVGLLIRAAVCHNLMDALSPTQMGEALGISRQAVHSRIKHSSLPSVWTPKGLRIPVSLLHGPDHTKAAAFLFRGFLHA